MPLTRVEPGAEFVQWHRFCSRIGYVFIAPFGLGNPRCRHIGIRGTIALQAVQQRQRYERSLCWLKGQRFKQNMVNVGIHGISLAIAIAMVKCTGLIRECITFFFLVGVLLYF
jgi:hypothetical protein